MGTAHKTKDSEFRAYPLITTGLKENGWDTRNPAKGGEVYNQSEFRRHCKDLGKALGHKAPEAIVVVGTKENPAYWTIEAKATEAQIGVACAEARGYAERINEHAGKPIARFATGWAGTEEGAVLVRTEFLTTAGVWKQVAINQQETTGLLDRQEIKAILEAGTGDLPEPGHNAERFLTHAGEINRLFHRCGIPVGDRAKMLAVILLAVAGRTPPRVRDNALEQVNEFNGLMRDVLRDHGKEEFSGTLALMPPARDVNHVLYHEALRKGLLVLRKMNIKSALRAGGDTLGEFYETFLKYANGAKEMGIVLTPRHVTRLAVEVCDVQARDRICDPAAGTGGFLVSALDKVRKEGGAPEERIADWLENGIWGCELEDSVYALALVNMIFRGDGKSGLNNRSCFTHRFWARDGRIEERPTVEERPEGAAYPFTKCFLNPPFGREGFPEHEFVDHALRQTREEGLVAAILPSGVVHGSARKQWRQETLKRHSLVACVRMSPNLFYPVSVQTYMVVLRAHTPHREEDRVAFARLLDDQQRPRLSKLVARERAPDNYDWMQKTLKAWIAGRGYPEEDRNEEWALRLLETGDGVDWGWAPEHYLPGPYLSKVVDAAWGGRTKAAAARYAQAWVEDQQSGVIPAKPGEGRKPFKIAELCEVQRGELGPLKGLASGDCPVVSNRRGDNGIAGFYKVAERFERAITVSVVNNSYPCEACFHPYGFNAVSGLIVLIPPPEIRANAGACAYLCEQITAWNRWRYHYEREVRVEELIVHLPVREDGSPDVGIMAKYAGG